MEITTEAEQVADIADLTESSFLGAFCKLRKTDNVLLICSMQDYSYAKELVAKYAEFRVRAIGVPKGLPHNGLCAWLLVDLNDLQAIYQEGW